MNLSTTVSLRQLAEYCAREKNNWVKASISMLVHRMLGPEAEELFRQEEIRLEKELKEVK